MASDDGAFSEPALPGERLLRGSPSMLEMTKTRHPGVTGARELDLLVEFPGSSSTGFRRLCISPAIRSTNTAWKMSSNPIGGKDVIFQGWPGPAEPNAASIVPSVTVSRVVGCVLGARVRRRVSIRLDRLVSVTEGSRGSAHRRLGDAALGDGGSRGMGAGPRSGRR